MLIAASRASITRWLSDDWLTRYSRASSTASATVVIGRRTSWQVPHFPFFLVGLLEHAQVPAGITLLHFLRSFLPCTASQVSLATWHFG